MSDGGFILASQLRARRATVDRDLLPPLPRFLDVTVTAAPVAGKVTVAGGDLVPLPAFYGLADATHLTVGAPCLVMALNGTYRVLLVYATTPTTSGGD